MSVLKPRIISRDQNSVLISWDPLPPTSLIILQIKNELKQWQTIYHGYKNEFKVKGLAPCSWYVTRIRPETETEWIELKIATTNGPFLVMHMTRAIKRGDTPLIRKIAHAQPYLLNTENKEMKIPLFQIIERDDLILANLLINLGANVNQPAVFSLKTPLMHAIGLGNVGMAQLLVDKGAKIDGVDCNGCGILHYAIGANCLNSVKFAIEQGSNIDVRDNKGMTALLKSVILECDEDIVQFLLQNGADPKLKDLNGFDYEKHLKLKNISHRK